MFENLTEKLQATFDRLGKRGKLTDKDISTGLREVRLALLEADVNYKVVKDFVKRVKERAVGADVIENVNAGQMVVKIVHEELIVTLGDEAAPLARAAAGGRPVAGGWSPQGESPGGQLSRRQHPAGECRGDGL